jgi:hypothetical protein
MNLKIYSVYDVKAKTWAQPFTCPTRGQALRSWDTVANDKESEISKYPEDFHLFEVGEFDIENGRVVPYQTSESLGLAIQFKRPN